MLNRFLALGCVTLTAFAAACSSTVESTAPSETVASTSQAVGEQCTGAVKAFAGNFTTNCSTVTATKNILAWDIKVLHTRAQAYFAYLMGGPVPSGTVNVGGQNVGLRDSYWSNSARSTGGRLCAIRNAIKANRATNGVEVEHTGDSEMICGERALLFHFGGEVLPEDGVGCDWTPPAGGAGVGDLIGTLGKNQQADRGWCVEGSVSNNLPSFLNVAWMNRYEALVDPEPVTLRGALSSTSTTASAEGVESLQTYTAYRFSSGLCGSALNTLMDSAQFGVPCVTTSASSGTQTQKYIKRSGSGSTAFCTCI